MGHRNGLSVPWMKTLIMIGSFVRGTRRGTGAFSFLFNMQIQQGEVSASMRVMRGGDSASAIA